jgi:hypothetical protein
MSSALGSASFNHYPLPVVFYSQIPACITFKPGIRSAGMTFMSILSQELRSKTWRQTGTQALRDSKMYRHRDNNINPAAVDFAEFLLKIC